MSIQMVMFSKPINIYLLVEAQKEPICQDEIIGYQFHMTSKNSYI